MGVRSESKTSLGSFTFAVKVSVGVGDISWNVWHNSQVNHDQRRAYTFVGDAMQEALKGESLAGPGDVVIGPSLWTLLEEPADAELLSGGFHRLGSLSERPAQTEISEMIVNGPIASTFFPEKVLELPIRGEFRIGPSTRCGLSSRSQNPSLPE